MIADFKISRLSEVCTIIAGQSPESKYYNKDGVGIPFFQGKADFGPLYPEITTYCSQPKKIAEKDDILLSVRAPVGPTNLAPCRVCIGRGLSAIRPNDKLIIKFVLLFFKYFEAQLSHKGTGTTFKAITQDVVKNLMIPVPPLPEQERIVAKIEELFSQLDAAVAELKSVKEKLAIYRQAVLKEAFDFENAKLVEISSIVDNIKIGPFGTMLHKSDYVEGGVPVINPQHIKNNTIVESSVIAISETKAKELENCKLQVNDVIMGRRGEMGRTAPVTMRENGWICGTGSIMIRLKKEYDATLYSKILASPQVVHFLEKMAKGTTMKNLNEKIVARIPVPKITRDIQDSILSNTSRKMSICDNIEQTVDTALQRAAAFRQSILKQAFEGNL